MLGELTMKPYAFMQAMQQRAVMTAIGPSALGGGGAGVINASQDFLGKLDLSRLWTLTARQYATWLDAQTASLLDALPNDQQPWGVARTAINLFLRECLYNQYLNIYFNLSILEAWLELPLDSAVAKGLTAVDDCDLLPPWPGLNDLDAEYNLVFQRLAAKVAAERGIERVHLDLFLGLENGPL